MATPSEKLAEALTALQELQDKKVIAIFTDEISSIHRRRLVSNGFLKEVVRGWYIPARPDEQRGDTTSWYISYWEFCARYLTARYADNWIISADQSLLLHAGNNTVPAQLMVRSPEATNFQTALLFNTSIFHMRGALPDTDPVVNGQGMRLYTLPSALVYSSQAVFTHNPTEARTALAMIADASDVLVLLLNGGHSTIAGRLCGAFRNIGRDKVADDISKAMKSAMYEIRETDPFEVKLDVHLSFRDRSPYANRLRLLWQSMRKQMAGIFPEAPGLPVDKSKYLQNVEELYVTDAYHSLSIERYSVTPELIERVRTGQWNSKEHEADRQQKDAMAARGYWQAFQEVKQSIAKILDGANAGKTANDDHQDWYRQLFAPSVAAGILRPGDLAGYRTHQVYIGGSKHVPFNVDAVRDTMPLLFELLENESAPAVRAVLGHFIFVNIHPYMDGNGRMGRFLMNVMLASGGYPWTVIPVEKRDEYMECLETASADGNIKPFASFIAGLVKSNLEGHPATPILTIKS
jgi:fido (protein-threonine AMPylation protein)